jgi:hypothetical protein
MNSPETQSDSSSTETYFDPEVMDNSEQEFSASLETHGEPSFVIDSPEQAEVVNFTENVGGRASRPSGASTEDTPTSSFKTEHEL